MRIVQLQAENVKRLKAVDITPVDDLVVIAGRNGQGKTSVLDAIWWTLAGKRSFDDSPDPVRHGQKQASARIDLGDLVVTRTWSTSGTTKLTVQGRDGSTYSSPQSMLDELIGSLSFDPLAFANMDGKRQRETLLGLVVLPFDLDELDRRRATIFEERTDTNRDLKRLSGALGLLSRPEVVPEGVVSSAEVVAEMQAATVLLRNNDEVRARLTAVVQRQDLVAGEIEDLERNLKAAYVRQAEIEVAARELFAEVAGLPADPDMDVLAARLADVERSNDAVRLAAEWKERASEVEDCQAQSDHLSALLAEIDEEKAAALAAAKMPAAGLALSDDGVLFRGVPLAQASGAERLRVSLAVAIAANPSLRVIRIADGSLLDDESLELVAEMAAFGDFQVWIEKVDSSGQVGIVIEDGLVVAVNEGVS